MLNIYQTINAVLADLDPIGKDKKNIQQGFKYRGIDDVMNAMAPLFAKYKLFVVPEVIDQKREERTTNKGGNLIYSIITMKYTFYAEDGSSISSVVIGEGMDSGDKASNKAMAIAFKYACFQVFCIPTEDTMPDPDKECHEVQRKQQSAAKPKAQPQPVPPIPAPPVAAKPEVTHDMLQNLYALAAFKGKSAEDVEKASRYHYKKSAQALTKAEFDGLEERLGKLPDVEGTAV